MGKAKKQKQSEASSKKPAGPSSADKPIAGTHPEEKSDGIAVDSTKGSKRAKKHSSPASKVEHSVPVATAPSGSAEPTVPRGKGDIDAIFSEASAKKRESQGRSPKEAAANGATRAKDEASGKKKRKRRDVAGSTPPLGSKKKSQPRRRTEEGYAVYCEEELQWNKKNAGGTKLCPFDCDCCF